MGSIDNASGNSNGGSTFQYEQKLVTEKEWIQKNITHDLPGATKRYLLGLFPILSWIYRYNLTWGIGGKIINQGNMF